MGYFMLKDGSRLLRFYRPLNNERCNEPDLHIRLLHENGTISPLIVQNFSVPKFNFCRLDDGDVLSPDYIIITDLGRNNLIYILYYNISDTDYNLPFGRFIVEVDLDGNILGENWLGYNNYYDGHIIGRLGTFKFIFDSYDTFYYMKLADIHDPNILEWQKFRLTPITGRLQSGESGNVTRKNLDLQYDNPLFSFQTVDSGLGYIYSKNYTSQVINGELQPTLYVYVNFYKPEINDFTEPFIIYQTSIPNIFMTFAMCSVDNLGIGYQCIIQLRKITSTNPLNNEYFGHNLVLDVSFLSSGSVTRIVQLSGNYEKADVVIKYPLTYGGYLLMYKNSAQNGCLLGGDIFDPNDIYYSTWDIPQNFIIQSPCISIYNFIYMRFESIWKITPTDLTIVSTDVPRFILFDGENFIYCIHTALTLKPAKISTIEPQYGANISLGRNNLIITYEVPISLSVRNITIYKVDGTNVLMRQTTSGQASEFFSIDNDMIVSLNLLSSTFNERNVEYHVSIDPNFVMHKETNEPIDRLQHTSWILFTNSTEEDPYADYFSGSIRLTPEGTALFNKDKKTFVNQLLQEISLILPVDLDRLKIEDRQQVDTSTPLGQLIIPLQIEPTKNLSKRNTYNLHNDLNTMILNKPFTKISNYPYTSLLDQSYGYKLNVGIKELILDNKETILAAIVVFFIILLVYLWARRKGERNEDNKNKKGSYMIVLKVGLSIMDFVLDGLFIYKNGYDITILFIPSLVIFAFVSVFNLISALSLIIYENFKHDKFREWLKENAIIASVFTLFSATNVEVLNILSSNVFEIFSANFKKKTESLIFWFGVTNFIIKDIPQFYIQVYYITHIISYNIIPFLNLVTSSAMIVLNVIGKLYKIIIECQKQNSEEGEFADEESIDDDKDK
ncbi:hypothetical protein RclHR1_04750011 [Rhizophagus clarus]|uniref:Uncharacterized protein n=1 Tax=Rhizophagus clarus TaxID=94130 RepID=A0A2Z6RP36_9GLOM|nr:hypothetical protein RclHR1_04750011 [Rhizophagus clarus]